MKQGNELPFSKELYELCTTIGGIGRRCSGDHEPLSRMLDAVIAQVGESLIDAIMSADVHEQQGPLLVIVTSLHTACWALFTLGMQGAVEHQRVCAILDRCAAVQCGLLVWYREQCV